MKNILVTVICCGSFLAAAAQTSYDRALGLKFPGGFSVSYKQFLTETNNVEVLGTFKGGGFRLTGLYEFNFYTLDVEGLSWFVGPGAHIGFGKEDQLSAENKTTTKNTADLGIDGIIGLDYKFRDLPLNVSLDWQPSIVIAGNTNFSGAYGGLGIRYTF
ncbi:hypothetical protein [Foetidibacter luteolus]|uniref:hypothetical protein n=1 Tax=Foetidibacter luteolus TaxID=2608880 RepID=UPI00129BBCD6|nr:hypothetical protein [Foetidibacter luteolus]